MQSMGSCPKGPRTRETVKNEAEEADGEEDAVARQMSPPDERNWWFVKCSHEWLSRDSHDITYVCVCVCVCMHLFV